MFLLVWINLALAFAVELVALYILGYWGFHLPFAPSAQWLLGLGVPSIFLIAWQRWAAPKARHRLKGWKLWFYKIVVLSVPTAILWSVGQTDKASLYQSVTLANLVLLWMWRDHEPRPTSLE